MVSVLRYLPPLLVMTMIGFVYTVYLVSFLVPVWRASVSGSGSLDKELFGEAAYTQGQTYLIAMTMHLLLAMLLWSFTAAARAEPGRIPNTEIWRTADFGISSQQEDKLRHILNIENNYSGAKLQGETGFLKSLTVVERKQKNGNFRFCSTCELYKPDRTHHCSVCGRCVLRMDHHCPWINNCVGFYNYKYFALLLIYCVLATAFIMGSMWPRFIHSIRPYKSVGAFFSSGFPVILAFVFCLGVFGTLSTFLGFQINLVINALSTIELREKQNSTNKFVNHRFSVAHAKFDRGSAYQNWLHVFGSPYMWLIPVESNYAPDGTYSHVDVDEADAGILPFTSSKSFDV